MFLPECRHRLPALISAIANHRSEEASIVLNEQIDYLASLKKCKMDVDVVAFIELVMKSRKTLLGKLRLLKNREARKAR